LSSATAQRGATTTSSSSQSRGANPKATHHATVKAVSSGETGAAHKSQSMSNFFEDGQTDNNHQNSSLNERARMKAASERGPREHDVTGQNQDQKLDQMALRNNREFKSLRLNTA